MTSSTDDVPEIRVRVLPLNVELTVHPGESLMAAAQRVGYFWPTRCQGQALCTACLFEVVSGNEEFAPIEPLEQGALESLSEFQAKRERPLRLGCQARPGGPAAVFKRGMKPADRPRPSTGFWG
ncbi:2Fe-2S iron-sulfur cluster-binding protein [Streptomyces mirabilis]|uniref:2Fe-2S iron-sulfur cluster-binding protein n=1 Tax=Streptomyces mirabilis TaxID=68239 RepID=UPI0036EBA039